MRTPAGNDWTLANGTIGYRSSSLNQVQGKPWVKYPGICLLKVFATAD